MTNFEMIKNFEVENMALTIMCPYEAGLLDEYRCKKGKDAVVGCNCLKCVYEWLQEETGE